MIERMVTWILWSLDGWFCLGGRFGHLKKLEDPDVIFSKDGWFGG